MKTFRLIGVVAFAIILFANFFACSSEPIVPEVTVEMGNEDYFVKNMVFDSSAGEKTFSFNSNVEWTVSVAPTMDGETWCIVTPNSGIEGKNSIRVQVQENTEYDDRSVVLTLTAGSSLTKTITVTQKQKDAIFISNKKYEVGSKGETIEVELNTNVDLDIVIKDSWIKQTESRGMINRKLYFQVEANENYDARTAYIAINDKNRLLTDTIRICQAQKDTIIIEQKIFDIPAIGWEFSINLSSNIDCKLIIPDKFKEWIKESAKTRGLTTNTYSFSVPNNKTDNAKPRKGFILIKSQIGSDTIFVNQDAPIWVNEAGTLKNYLNIENLESYKTLTLVGEINGTDVLFIRRMKNISHIDIEDCNIVEGGNIYVYDEKTSNNTIGSYMFYDLPIENIILPKSIKKIDGYAFYGCSKLKSITIPEGVTRIGTEAFCDCDSLEKILLPESLKEFGIIIFSDCKFETITIPKNVTTLGTHMFVNCNSLKEIHIKSLPDVLTDIPSDIVSNKKDYERITLYIPKGTKDAYFATGLGNFTNIIEE